MSAIEQPPPTNSAVDVLSVLIHHNPFLLTLREMGRLSIVNKQVAAAFEHASVWKIVLEKVAAAGETYSDLPSDWETTLAGTEHCLFTWVGEEGLLGCFSKPTAALLDRVGGYKTACGCLLGKTCVKCGVMTGHANPLTLKRTCTACAEKDETSFVIGKSKAKEAFLLTEKDIKNHVHATFRAKHFLTGKPCTSVLFLMSDIQATAYAKYGGADGLAAEFATRKAKANTRFDQSQNTAKPLKKRPKITHADDRPGDRAKYLTYFCGSGLQVGVPVPSPKGGIPGHFVMTCRCAHCKCAGSVPDVALHSRLCHNTDLQVGQVIPVVAGPSPEAPSLDQIPGMTDVLRSWVARASFQFGAKEFAFEVDVDYESMDIHDTRKYCTIDFLRTEDAAKTVKISVDISEWHDEYDYFSGGEITVAWQSEDGALPVKLLNMGVHEESFASKLVEASSDQMQSFMKAIGLDQSVTSTVSVFLMLLSRIMSLKKLKGFVSGNKPFCPTKYPILDGLTRRLDSKGN